MAKKSVADLIAEEITEWLEEASTDIAEAILGSALAPAVVQPSRDKALEFYRSRLYLPDGSPNPVGRDEIMAKYGQSGYQDIALALAGAQTAELPTELMAGAQLPAELKEA